MGRYRGGWRLTEAGVEPKPLGLVGLGRRGEVQGLAQGEQRELLVGLAPRCLKLPEEPPVQHEAGVRRPRSTATTGRHSRDEEVDRGLTLQRVGGGCCTGWQQRALAEAVQQLQRVSGDGG
jgi:hypothetical protein